MNVLVSTIAAISTAVVVLSTAPFGSAAPPPANPGVCGKPADPKCLIAEAIQAARRHVGGPGGMFQGSSSCRRVSKFTLTYSCQLGTQSYIVRFRKPKARWIVTVTP